MNGKQNVQPRVSVVVPTFNRAAMVREAIDSVFSQTWPDFELIVVDDGSTDSTAEDLASLSERLTFLHQENRGVSSARNRGVAAAQGDLIAFLDSDDLWEPEKLAVQVSYLDTFPSAALCHTDEIWMRRGVRVNPGKRLTKAEGRPFSRLLRDSLISPSALVIRRQVLDDIGGFDESLPACEDYDLWLRLVRKHDIHLIRRPLVIKRGGREDQLSRTIWGLDRYRVKVLSRLADDESLTPAERADVCAVLSEKCRIVAEGCRRRGRLEDAERYLSLAGKEPCSQ